MQTAYPHKAMHLIISALLLGLSLTSCAASPPQIERNEHGDLIPYANVQNAHATSWNETEIVDDTHLRLKFTTSQWSACERLGAHVIETDTSIKITLRFGELPNAEKLCANESKIVDMYSKGESILVETTAPIGNRTIIDTKTTQAHPVKR